MDRIADRMRSFVVFAACLAAMGWPVRASAQSYPPAWSSTTAYSAGDIVQYGGNWYRAMKALSASGPYPANAYGDWELNFVRSNTTLTIGDGQGFANLAYAWQFARNARVADAAYVHFDIVTSKGDFNETFTAPFSLDQGSGALMSIIGDNANNIVLTFTKASAFTIDTGHNFGAISGLTVSYSSGTGRDLPPLGSPPLALQFYYGITALSGGSIASIANTNFANFSIAIYASQNSFLDVAGSCAVQFCGAAIWTDYGATVIADGLEASFVNSSTSALNANHDSKISDQGGRMENSDKGGQGVAATNGGIVDISNSTISGWDNGAFGQYAGTINADDAKFSDNTKDVSVSLGAGANVLGASTPDGTEQGTNDGSYIWN